MNNVYRNTLIDIGVFRDAVKDADTLEQLMALADEIVGHHTGFDDDDARTSLLDYLDEWEFDVRRNEGGAA